MMKPIYDFKDVFCAWRTKLHQAFEGWQGCQQLHAQPELYCVHTCQPTRIKDRVGRAQAHNFEQQGTREPRSIIPGSYTPKNLQCLLSVHVGDIQGIAPKSVAESFLRHMNESEGRCNADCFSFFHIGIQFGHSPGVLFTHQYVYVDSIQPLTPELYSGKGDEALCDGPCHEAYRSVPGAVAWTVLTRAGLAVYVQVFQRRAHAPRVTDCKRLSPVLRHMRRHKCG